MFLFTVLHLSFWNFCAAYYKKKVQITIPTHTQVCYMLFWIENWHIWQNLEQIGDYFLHDSGSCNTNKYYREQEGIFAETLIDF